MEALDFDSLTNDQRHAVDAVARTDRNVFLSGSAGVGKSAALTFALKRYYGGKNADAVVVTATTGVAACQIEAITLHKWVGLGLDFSRFTTDKVCSAVAKNPTLRGRWRRVELLVIEEISMLSADLLNKLDAVGRKIRRKPDVFCGGVRVVVCGDFFQLPPVPERTGDDGDETLYAFQSEAWAAANFLNVVMTEPVRQREDLAYWEMLERIKWGAPTVKDVALLRDRTVERLTRSDPEFLREASEFATNLYPDNRRVDGENLSRLLKLPGPSFRYAARATVVENSRGATSDAREIDGVFQRSKAVLQKDLELRKNAMVMLTSNLCVERGLVNGSQGAVVDLSSETVRVRFFNGKEREIKPKCWTFWEPPSGRYGPRIVAVTQIPLRLAWASTIHKSQGMTYDRANVHLSGVFEPSQPYVALSRLCRLSYLVLQSFDPTCLHQKNEAVASFYRRLGESPAT